METGAEYSVKDQQATYEKELTAELANILNYWMANTVDEQYGGFYGRIDNDNHVIADSPKGAVLNARILWSFSAAYNLDPDKRYLAMANRAYQYILKHFIDAEFGGVYWSVDHLGNPLDTKKQVYASAFTIYALSEYHKASGAVEAKDYAVELYRVLVDKSYDTQRTGYLEAFTKEWQPIADLRLSAKDANEKKSMNTHLHVLEAYTTLYSIWPDGGLRIQIQTLINNFLDHIIDSETNHLVLFFDEDWNKKGNTVSYGHDIEATWLLLEAAEAVEHHELIEKIKQICIKISDATKQGLDTDGGLWYEYEPAEGHLIKEKHWWVQAEAMVGFYNTWQISNNKEYLELSLRNWAFVKQHILDIQNGEWFWGVYADGNVMQTEDKAGIWKCPYHNSRACIELIKRISRQ
ncbi:N-acyl-D-glucosamine 2-epimerase [Mucilaginibacter sp. 14171R-50]|uniref:AGE family epimerase/isomerase n=1 Tax=Mucilaginibacter sp. 14171R-50 TaxID=2703789 RepID=UPI00138D8787|nr:AGE family epimerase/isomerase [Mucilaginibacter sp. 14171R-50]QHS55509.1 N-acyl-D-glucosamine 2-epimerase [Mucilaginibacter sp. 14171R-50]